MRRDHLLNVLTIKKGAQSACGEGDRRKRTLGSLSSRLFGCGPDVIFELDFLQGSPEPDPVPATELSTDRGQYRINGGLILWSERVHP